MNAQGTEAEKPPTMSPWSLQIAKVAGIPIRLHFTFLLFLAWIGSVGGQQGSYTWPLLVVSVFGCVVLHELGHALTALRYGIKTRDITLYPIGGLAVLESRPNPGQELVIAFAGPMVNLVIGGILFIALGAIQGKVPDFGAVETSRSFIGTLLLANFALALFNLIPAFPMDGGRVLRAALALKLGVARATQIAATIGQGLAILIGFVGLFSGQYILMLVAFFVFLGAGQEASATLTRSFLDGHTVRDAMQTRYRTITHGDNLETASEMLLAGSQHDFPVVIGDETAAILTRNDIARGIASGGPSLYVSDVMQRDFKRANPGQTLESAIELFSKGNQEPVLVMDGNNLIGLLTSENVSEFIMLEAAKAHNRKQ